MISAVIITHNEADHLPTCLDSIQGLVDEIIVVDAESDDATEEICKQHGLRFFSRKWTNYSDSKNFGNAQAKFPYILSIDADEALSEELQASIRTCKPSLSGAYRFPRKNIYCGQWIRHCGWYPDHKLRLFPKDKARWEGEYVHEKIQLDPTCQISLLEGDLIHHTNDSLDDHIDRIRGYADLHAQALFVQGKRSNWRRLWLVPLYRFFRMYVIQQGFREGYLGFQLCKVSAFAVFLKYAKLKHLWDEQA